ncbi:MAG: hypothetical protein DCC73_08470 [Proteobacteria bacterium]|nr:MAG: hypothetical protein DCC73_08470 [Pseudomonadota bacterium]
MNALFYLLVTLINLYQFVLIAMVVMSWLISFGVINTYNRFVATLWEVLNRLTEPVLRPVRNILPNLGGLDLSPVVVLILLQVLKVFIVKDLAAALGVY